MVNTRRTTRSAADVALGYAADANGNGIVYATIANGSATRTVRLTFTAKPFADLDGREHGYAAVAAVADHLKKSGFGRARLRFADERVAAELSGDVKPPKALAMAYVRVRCSIRGIGVVRIEPGANPDVRDLTARATAEIGLHAAA